MTIPQMLETFGNVPLHSVMMIAIVIMWRRINVLQEKLDNCLKERDTPAK